MQKISERYESNLRKYTLIFGLIVALLINADFFEIYRSLSRNALARGTLAAQAEMVSGRMALISSQIDRKGEERIAELKAFREDTESTVSRFTEELSRAELSLGWKWQDIEHVLSFFGVGVESSQKVKPDKNESGSRFLQGLYSLFNKLLGIMISGLLISFGAPFWHDFLGSVVGVNKILRSKAVNPNAA